MEKRDPDIAFTRNPIRFTDLRPGTTLQRSFTVKADGVTAYTGHYAAPATIDIGEIAGACVNPIPDPEDGFGIGDAEHIRQLEGPADFQRRSVTVLAAEGPPLKRAFYALPGGVSPQNFRRLAQLDTDIFAARLLDKRHNFFLTTRTHGWRIVMDELEIYPLTFVNLEDRRASTIEVRVAGTDHSVSMGDEDRGIYAVDIARIRADIARGQGFLGSVFDILCDGYLACQVVIKETRPELQTTLVKFRNSLGAFELAHLSGARQTKLTPEEARGRGLRYCEDTGRYETVSPRRGATHVFAAATGFRDNDELAFILDMTASEEVYLRLRAGWTKVVPSVEAIEYSDPQERPVSVKVSFAMAEERDNQTPDIRDLEDFERPRIFSDEHTDEFN